MVRMADEIPVAMRLRRDDSRWMVPSIADAAPAGDAAFAQGPVPAPVAGGGLPAGRRFRMRAA
jgi:hypothetical protein